MRDRRFDEDEIREILLRATEPRDAPTPVESPGGRMSAPGHSLTLTELQEVAGEAGIPAIRVAEAAAALESDQALVPPQTYMGVPISAEHVVRLPRMMEPDEWDRFVVRLRDTFDAVGSVQAEGSLRTWSNGNLNVRLEPLEEGAWLRFQSVHGESKSYLEGSAASMGAGMVLAAAIAAVAVFGTEAVPAAIVGIAGGVPAIGAAMWAIGRAKAARWLPMRRSGFRSLGDEAARVVRSDGDGAPPAALPGGSE